jgi:lipoyl(octanoyl) transferase
MNINHNCKKIEFDQYEFQIFDHIMPYNEGIEIMKSCLDDIIEKRAKQQILIFEHEDVYTAGRMARDESDIVQKNLEIIYTDRGGKLTYHGPGQRVIYPILNLTYFNQDIRQYVAFLQELVIKSLDCFGIKAHIDKAGVGVWTIQDNDLYKIASIGIKIKKWFSYHGIAINIFNDLNKFNAIIPCGIKDYKHTSIQKLGIQIDLQEFDKVFIKTFNDLYILLVNEGLNLREK